MEPPRSFDRRKADTLARLGEYELDGWVASAGADGAYLVPLSVAHLDGGLVLALAETSRTARSIVETGRCRIGFGPTRDVVLVDAVLETAVLVGEADRELVERYVRQAGWDPRFAGQVLLTLRPERIQAWREANELRGRTLMRDGEWLG